MRIIDGSLGQGGGQSFRTSLALAVIRRFLDVSISLEEGSTTSG